MPSAFICLGKCFNTFFQKKIVCLSKAPLPFNWKLECSVHFYRGPWSRSNWDLSFWPQLSCSHVTRPYWRSHHGFYFSGVRADQHLDVEIVGCNPHQPDHNTVCTYMVRLMGTGGLGAGSLAKVESSKFQYCYSGAWYYSGSHYYHSSNALTPTPLQGQEGQF